MLDLEALRSQFPALQQVRDGVVPVFFDGSAGTQVPRRVMDAIVSYLGKSNANHGGVFATSRESDRIVWNAHEAVADLLNAPSAREIVFGPNMTTLTFQLSRALARTWKAGDEVIVTRLDHDANVSPWVLAARDAGAVVRHADIHPEDCTLDLDDLKRQLGAKTRLLAVTCASNAVGTMNDVKAITRLGHEAGALVFLDAVHYAPHGPIDVQDWDCDFLACSAYKFFGPHIGILWGRAGLLESLPAYKLRPVPDSIPDRWMTGTQNFECLAGVAEAVEYLAAIGRNRGSGRHSFPGMKGRRLQLHCAMAEIQDYEAQLSAHLLESLATRPRFEVWGITDPARLRWRAPTISFSLKDRPAIEIAEHLASRQIYTWSGNMYAIEVTERLGLEDRGGLLRVGMVHYNTRAEIDRLARALDEL
jgi:cysteine desulfurase family protein (TIGR01976 family)